MRNIPLFTPSVKSIALSLLFAFGVSVPNSFAQSSEADGDKMNLSDARSKMYEVLNIIDKAYIDEPDHEEITETAIKNVLKELDPHSVYIPADELKKMNEPLKGNFEGIGIQFNLMEDTVVVVGVIAGGPSEKVGIMAGDKIVTVDGKAFAGTDLENNDVMVALKGPKDTKVTVGVKRRKVKELIDFTITRDKIPIHSLDASYIAKPGIGYIKLNRFSATTVQEFKDALVDLKAQGMEHLVLDLKGNGGGYLKAAVQLADEFLDKGELVTYTEGRSFPRKDYNASSSGGFQDGMLAVLIDEGSASASEIVSGAIQDWDRGLVVGRRSYGKGLVQKPFPLSDGSAMRLTISNYYTPAGRSIQKPYEEGKESYLKDIRTRLEKGELTDLSKIEFPDSLKHNTLRSKRTVYGGGGIMPDMFVPLDTTSNTKMYRDVNRQGMFQQFLLTYMDKERKSLEKEYQTEDDFVNNYTVGQKFFDEFIEYVSGEGVDCNDEQLALSEKSMRIRMKALVARYLFGTSAYFRVANENNEALQTAITAMEDNSFKKMKIAVR